MQGVSIIKSNVKLGIGSKIDEGCVVGYSPSEQVILPTKIGNNAKLRTHTVIYHGTEIGDNFMSGHHVLIRESCCFGNNISIGSHSVIEHHVSIADGVRIHSCAFIPEFTRIDIGAWIGPRACFTNSKYPATPTSKDHLAAVTIGTKAIIGANVTVLPGITIGSHAFVGAGSVVTKNVPDFHLVAGNPAIFIRDVRELKENDRQIYGLTVGDND